MDKKLPEGLKIRNCQPTDHSRITAVMKPWWNGRDLVHMLPKLFLIHFCDTSFIIEKERELVAFLVGFLSQSIKTEGYIHFSGVHPDFQGQNIGTVLYNQFFKICRDNQRNIVRACTSPVNTGSIAYHTKIGFEIEDGDSVINGYPVTLDYNRPDDPKVLFKKVL